MQDALEMNNEAQVKLQADRLAETFQRLIEGLEELRSGLQYEGDFAAKTVWILRLILTDLQRRKS